MEVKKKNLLLVWGKARRRMQEVELLKQGQKVSIWSSCEGIGCLESIW